jgi:DNA invertase Pin-like site-specific DNA recombinase
MNKIRAEHLARKAFVYIRQSTLDQVQHNLESQRRQYALAKRAKQLGWSEVITIDDDLGRSGSGIHRPGFERLLAALCQGNVGAVFCIEASRLARNGRDWHTLLEFCRLVDALLVDEDDIYDPRQPNDRLLLGMKGTLSEMELSTLRQRSQVAIMEKAKRGELNTNLPVGYLRTSGERIEMDPDRRVQEALELAFVKFQQMASVRQVLLWMRQERIEMPAYESSSAGRHLVWKLPVYNTLLRLLNNPIYAGAYVFGRTNTVTRIENGRKRVLTGRRRPQEHWDVLLFDHHQGYITWDQYQTNKTLIAHNANMKGAMVRGSVKRGAALLAGLLRCGHCGRKLHVAYSGEGAGCVRYHCRGGMINHGEHSCISFGGLRPDEQVSKAVLEQIAPLGIQAAIAAIEEDTNTDDQRLRHKELALEQLRFEVSRARRQYDAVDPENRLVAAELENRWNETLVRLNEGQAELEQLRAERPARLDLEQQRELMALAQDLPATWNHPVASSEIKKRILRTVINEIVASVADDRITLVLHWTGGDHTEIRFKRNTSGQHRFATDRETQDLIRDLARVLPDKAIASLLNRLGRPTGHGHGWTSNRVCTFRNRHDVEVYRDGERRERGELTLDETAKKLGVSEMSVIRYIRRGSLAAKQACPGAPWVIKESDVDALRGTQSFSATSQSANREQLSIPLQ